MKYSKKTLKLKKYKKGGNSDWDNELNKPSVGEPAPLSSNPTEMNFGDLYTGNDKQHSTLTIDDNNKLDENTFKTEREGYSGVTSDKLRKSLSNHVNKRGGKKSKNNKTKKSKNSRKR